MLENLVRKPTLDPSSLATGVDLDKICNKVYRLSDSKLLNLKQKLAHYSTPDYCLVTRAETLSVLLVSLENLFQQEGVLFEVYRHVKTFADLKKGQIEDGELVRVVIFFDDPKIDMMAEELGVETRLKNHDCLLPFKASGRTSFEQFNSR